MTDTTTSFSNRVCIGSSRETGCVFVDIRYGVDNPGRLSISGVEGPRSNGNAKGGAGQIVGHWTNDYLDSLTLDPDWPREKVEKLREVWDRWHLNDLRAGSPAQEEWKRANEGRIKVAAVYPTSHYAAVLELIPRTLNPDPNYLHDGQPYRYGSAWLTEEVPTDVIEWLRGLPTTRHSYPW